MQAYSYIYHTRFSLLQYLNTLQELNKQYDSRTNVVHVANISIYPEHKVPTNVSYGRLRQSPDVRIVIVCHQFLQINDTRKHYESAKIKKIIWCPLHLPHCD